MAAARKNLAEFWCKEDCKRYEYSDEYRKSVARSAMISGYNSESAYDETMDYYDKADLLRVLDKKRKELIESGKIRPLKNPFIQP